MMNEDVQRLTEQFTRDIVATIAEAARKQLFALLDATYVPKTVAHQIEVVGRVVKRSPPKFGLAVSRARSAKVSDTRVLDTIAASSKAGVTAVDLGKAVGLAPGALSYRLGKLRRQKMIRSAGKTSKTRYFLAGKK